jgi:hypothetical protein
MLNVAEEFSQVCRQDWTKDCQQSSKTIEEHEGT